MRMKALVQIMLLGFVLSACEDMGRWMGAEDGRHTDTRKILLETWGQRGALDKYFEFKTLTGLLKQKIAEMCMDPSEETIARARDQWWGARTPWKETEVFAFGPYKKEPLRLGPKIDFWPVRPDSIESVLAGESTLTDEYVAGLGSAQAGMPVIEYLLYAPGEELLALLSSEPRRCDYLNGAATDLENHATEMYDAWSPDSGNFYGELVNAGNDTAEFENLHESFSEIVNRMGFTLENVRNDKLGRPLGDTSGGSPQPEKAESFYSGRSLQDIKDNLSGVELLYFGDAANDAIGLDDYLREQGYAYTPLAEKYFANVNVALESNAEPLSEGIVISPDSVRNLMDELKVLQRFIQVDVANPLSVIVSFNDTDGD